MDGYTKLRYLGGGSFGEVHLYKKKDTNSKCVIKVTRMAELEVSVLSSFQHPCIIQYIDSFEDSGKLCIVMEYCKGGDMDQHIKEQMGLYFDEEQIWDWLFQMCLAMKHIHGRKTLHRDIKSANIFLTDSDRIKLGDFGEAKKLEHTLALANTVRGTPLYMSPEMLQNLPYNDKNDIWAIGCVLCEMVALTYAFPNIPKILQGSHTTLPAGRYSKDLIDMISYLLQKDPNGRPSASEVLKKISRYTRLGKNDELSWFIDNEEPNSSNKHIQHASGPPSTLPQQQNSPSSNTSRGYTQSRLPPTASDLKLNKTNEDNKASSTGQPTQGPPVLPPKPVRELARVMFPWSVEHEDELELKEGDVITVLCKELEDKGWWRGESNGKVGVFPDNFVQLFTVEQKRSGLSVQPGRLMNNAGESVNIPTASMIISRLNSSSSATIGENRSKVDSSRSNAIRRSQQTSTSRGIEDITQTQLASSASVKPKSLRSGLSVQPGRLMGNAGESVNIPTASSATIGENKSKVDSSGSIAIRRSPQTSTRLGIYRIVDITQTQLASSASVKPKSLESTKLRSDSTEAIMKNTVSCDKRKGLEIRKFAFSNEYANHSNLIRRLSVGAKNDKPTKTLLLVGWTGAGMTSLISSLANIAYGIRYEDKFRIEIVDEECPRKDESESVTEWITIYEFNYLPGMSIDYNLTVIDTPGLHNTRGVEYDQLMVERLEKMFSTPEFGVNELHCIGLVTQASNTRLTQSMMYVYEICMRMFGNDVKDIIHIMATFAEGSEPAIIDPLKEAGVEYNSIYEFTNIGIYLDNDSQNKRTIQVNSLSWDYINDSCTEFLGCMHTTPGQSLTLTKQTIQSRRALHELHDTLSKTEPTFTSRLADALSFESKLEECSEKALNCYRCRVTCHKPCNSGKLFSSCDCKDLSKKGKVCKVCGCAYNDHQSERVTFTIFPVGISIRNKIKLITALKQIQSNVAELARVALRPEQYSVEGYFTNLIEVIKMYDKEDQLREEKLTYLKVLKQEEVTMQIFLNDDAKIEQLISRLEKTCNY